MTFHSLKIKNYKITSTHLGYEDHGIFTFYLNLKGADGVHVSVGGYALDSPDNLGIGLLAKRSLTLFPKIKRYTDTYTLEKLRKSMLVPVDVPRKTIKGVTLIAKILDTVGVANWEELSGKYIRVEDNGLGSYITKFGNLIEDKWIDLDDYFKGDPED